MTYLTKVQLLQIDHTMLKLQDVTMPLRGWFVIHRLTCYDQSNYKI